jgi:glucokinase
MLMTLTTDPGSDVGDSRPSRPGPASAAVVAVDVGGTDMKTAVLDADGELVSIEREPTPHGPDAADEIIERLAHAVERARIRNPEATVGAVGLAVPGLVDDIRGVGLFASNLTWQNYPFRDRAAARTGLPVAFGHDVRAAGRAERELGVARTIRNVAVVTIGTGIASTIVIDDKTILADGFAGEIGHSIIDPGGAPCACGGRGHLEGIASARAIAHRYAERTGMQTRGSREVLELALRGDAVAQAVWQDAIDALALGLAQIVAIAGPEAIVIGGGLAQAGDELFVPLEAALDVHLSFQRRPTLLRARLGENAGLLGTALAARRQLAS